MTIIDAQLTMVKEKMSNAKSKAAVSCLFQNQGPTSPGGAIPEPGRCQDF